jgi:glycosyltransferase involved in cell wall biosynthesis
LIAQGVPADRLKVIYAGIDPDDYAPTQKRRALARQLLAAGEDEWLVGFTGRIVADKGIPTLIALARRFKQRSEKVRFVLIGDGPLRPQVEAIARDENLPLQCLSFRADVPLLLVGLDAYVHPSRYESFCLSVLEAMAAGLPVIASKVGGLPELVTPETGILIDALDNLDAWDDALRALWRERERAQALGEAARRRVTEHFPWHRFADEHAAVYEKVIAAWR